MTELKPKTKMKKNNQGKGGGVPSRKKLYTKVACHAEEMINILVKMARGTIRADPVRMGAAKALLNKALPDLRQQEIVGDQEKPLLILDYGKTEIQSVSTTAAKTVTSV